MKLYEIFPARPMKPKNHISKILQMYKNSTSSLILQKQYIPKVLNSEWEDIFRQKYPHFRPVKIVETKEVAA